MSRQRGRILVKILAHSCAIVALYLVFSYAMFLGLQVRVLYGNIGFGITAVLVAAYVYFGFIKK